MTALKFSKEAQTAYAIFKSRQSNPEVDHGEYDFRQYDTALAIPTLLKIIGEKMQAEAETVPDSWEIAFKYAVRENLLEAISNWERPVTASEREMLEKIPTREVKQRYATDPAFRDLWDRYDRHDPSTVDLDSPYVGLSAEQVRAIPVAELQRLQNIDPRFGRAVQALRDAGRL